SDVCSSDLMARVASALLIPVRFESSCTRSDLFIGSLLDNRSHEAAGDKKTAAIVRAAATLSRAERASRSCAVQLLRTTCGTLWPDHQWSTRRCSVGGPLPSCRATFEYRSGSVRRTKGAVKRT